MNKYLSAIVLVATIVLTACSGGGSGSGATTTTTTTATWGITSFTASDDGPFIGSVVTLTAVVTKDGSAAPAGTTVEITVAGPDGAEYGLGSVGTYTHRLATSAGSVNTTLIANTAGVYSLQARVFTVKSQLQVTYSNRDQSDVLQIHPPLAPNQGSFQGGEQVLIRAKGLEAPAEVDFIVGSTTFHAEVVEIQASVPLSAIGALTIRTPKITTDIDQTTPQEVKVVVRGGIGTGNAQVAELLGGFTYLPEAPFLIYQPLIPNEGNFDGGEEVTLNGVGIREHAVVLFSSGGTDYPAQLQNIVVSDPVSAPGSIVILTPFISGADRTQPLVVDVKVTMANNIGDILTVELPGAFTYQPDAPFEIYQPLDPNFGRFDGGADVTLNGVGVRENAEVTFTIGGSDFPAQVQSVSQSDPLSGPGSIVVQVPYIPDSFRGQITPADVKVVTWAGVGDQFSVDLPGAYTYFPDPDEDVPLQIYQPLEPNVGEFDGGEAVLLRGRAIQEPVEVIFTVEGVEYPGIVQSVLESSPLAEEGQIVVETPYISASDWTEEIKADVKVTVLANSGDAESVVLPQAFTFRPDDVSAEPFWTLSQPSFYAVVPASGRSQGGDLVTVMGRNFRAEFIDPDTLEVTDTAPAVESVVFGTEEAIVQTVSADGTQIQLLTPRYSVVDLDQDTLVAVTITTSHLEVNGGSPFEITKADAFVYLADNPTPEITSIAPTGGPLDGGTQVTIFGHGFKAPMQVTFGDLEAINVEVNDDQTLADQDTIICVTPDYSQQPDVEVPYAVDVVAKNVLSGLVSDPATYFYGDNLYISGNSPVEGGPGDQIIIYGSGFEAPLTVDFAADIRMEVLSVSGTEILVRLPVDTPPSCSNVTGEFVVTLLESGSDVSGGEFTYLGSNPQIFGVDPIFVQEEAGGDVVSPFQVVINGDFFNTDLIVEVGDFRIANIDIEVLNANIINVNRIPSPNDFGIVWDQSPCVTDLGLEGVQNNATPVDVTVINLPGNCSDTLAGGLVYEPEQPVECVVAPAINVLLLNFPATPEGSCSAPQQLTIQNLGQGSLDVQLLTLFGPFYFNSAPGGVGGDQSAGPLVPPVPPFGSDVSLEVFFCPILDDGLNQLGQLNVVSNDPNSPTSIPLAGKEVAPIMVVNPQSIDFGNSAGNLDFEISNTGDGPLNWSIPPINDPGGVFAVAPPLNGLIAAGAAPFTVTVTFSPLGAPGAVFSGSLDVTAGEPDAQGAPVTVILDAENP